MSKLTDLQKKLFVSLGMSEESAGIVADELDRLRSTVDDLSSRVSTYTALIEETFDLLPRINDDDPMGPALREWRDRAKKAIARKEP